MDAVTLVSIITPAYNAERFIGETIASVQAQTMADWEMLIADDCSHDGTRDIIARASNEDRRIRLVELLENTGPAAARNAALSHARGRYVCFLDADDCWLPRKLERQLHFMGQTGCAICYTSYRRMDEDGHKLGRTIPVPDRLRYSDLLKNTSIAMLTTMVDLSQTGPIRFEDIGHEDYALWLTLLRRGLDARGLEEDLARYRVVGDSRSRRPLRSVHWVWRIYRYHENLSPLYALWCLVNYGTRAFLKRV